MDESCNIPENLLMPIITIDCPNDVDTEDLAFTKKECFYNAYQIAKKYPLSVKVIEGIIIVTDDNNCRKAIPHAWNQKGCYYFDITKEKIWRHSCDNQECKKVDYYFVKSHSYDELQSLKELEFCSWTTIAADSINNKHK